MKSADVNNSENFQYEVAPKVQKEEDVELTIEELANNLIDELSRAKDIIVSENLNESAMVEEIDSLINKAVYELENSIITPDTINDCVELLNPIEDLIYDNEIDIDTDLISDIDADRDRAFDLVDKYFSEQLEEDTDISLE